MCMGMGIHMGMGFPCDCVGIRDRIRSRNFEISSFWATNRNVMSRSVNRNGRITPLQTCRCVINKIQLVC